MELGMAAMFSPVHPPIPTKTWVLVSGVFAAGTLMVSVRRGIGGQASEPGSITGARDRAYLAMLSVSMVFAVGNGSTGPSSAHRHVATPAVAVSTAGVEVDRLAAGARGAPPILAWLLASYFVVYAVLSARIPLAAAFLRSAQRGAVRPVLLTGCDVATSAAMAYMLLT
jgi:hypothetical protein